MKEVFVVIGKRPISGFSKTRLEKDIGADLSVGFYESFILDFFQNYSKQKFSFPLYFFGTPNDQLTQNYFSQIFEQFGIDFKFFFQNDETFFQRLKSIFKFINDNLGESFIHLTGTDIPHFPFDVVTENLTNTIGPDPDGGFYYLATKSSNYKLFDIEQLQETRKNVFELITDKMNTMGIKPEVEKACSDIDTLEELEICIKKSSLELIPNTYHFYQKCQNDTEKNFFK